MSQQQDLHLQAREQLSELKKIIDKLKVAGPCPLDGWNALLNTRENLVALSERCEFPGMRK